MPQRRSVALSMMMPAMATAVLGGALFGALGQGLLPAIAGLVLGLLVALAIHGAVAATRRYGLLGSGLLDKVRASKPLLVVQHPGTIAAMLVLAGVLLVAAMLPLPLTARAVLGMGCVLALGSALVFLSLRWNAAVPSPTAGTPAHAGRSTVCLHAGLIATEVAVAAALGNWVVPQATGGDGTVLASLDQRLHRIEAAVADAADVGRDTNAAARRVEAKVDDIAGFLLERNEALAGDNARLRTQLRAALERVARAETAAGRDPLERLESLRQGDAHDLLAFLDEQIASDERDLIDKHREREAVAYLVGDIDRAEASLRTILALAPGDLNAMNLMGNLHGLRGDLDEAEAAYRRVLELAGEREPDQHELRKNKAARAAAYANLGVILRHRGDLEGAEAMHRRTLAMCLAMLAEHVAQREPADEGSVEHLGENLGEEPSEEPSEEPRQELSEDERALTVAISGAYSNLGNVLDDRGDPDGAEAMYRRALAIDERIGHELGVARTTINLANLVSDRGDLDGAEALYRKALAIDERLGHAENMAYTHANLGVIAIKRGDTPAARRAWTLALDLFTQLGAAPMVEQLQVLLDDLPPG